MRVLAAAARPAAAAAAPQQLQRCLSLLPALRLLLAAQAAAWVRTRGGEAWQLFVQLLAVSARQERLATRHRRSSRHAPDGTSAACSRRAQRSSMSAMARAHTVGAGHACVRPGVRCCTWIAGRCSAVAAAFQQLLRMYARTCAAATQPARPCLWLSLLPYGRATSSRPAAANATSSCSVRPSWRQRLACEHRRLQRRLRRLRRSTAVSAGRRVLIRGCCTPVPPSAGASAAKGAQHWRACCLCVRALLPSACNPSQPCCLTSGATCRQAARSTMPR